MVMQEPIHGISIDVSDRYGVTRALPGPLTPDAALMDE